MATAFRYDLSDIDQRYDVGRRPTPTAVAALNDALRREAPAKVRRVLDLRCGTGRYSHVLANAFDALVVAIEPAANMLGAAVAKELSPSIRFVGGSAEALPIAVDTFDVVFISQVLHHLPDLPAAMAEIRRVLATGGRLFVRQSTQENLDSYLYQRFFPSARSLDELRLPSRGQIIASARAVGLVETTTSQPAIRSEFGCAHQYVQKIATRTNSDLVMIPDEEFSRGMKEFTRYVDAHPDQVWAEEVDHLTFSLR